MAAQDGAEAAVWWTLNTLETARFAAYPAETLRDLHQLQSEAVAVASAVLRGAVGAGVEPPPPYERRVAGCLAVLGAGAWGSLLEGAALLLQRLGQLEPPAEAGDDAGAAGGRHEQVLKGAALALEVIVDTWAAVVSRGVPAVEVAATPRDGDAALGEKVRHLRRAVDVQLQAMVDALLCAAWDPVSCGRGSGALSPRAAEVAAAGPMAVALFTTTVLQVDAAQCQRLFPTYMRAQWASVERQLEVLDRAAQRLRAAAGGAVDALKRRRDAASSDPLVPEALRVARDVLHRCSTGIVRLGTTANAVRLGAALRHSLTVLAPAWPAEAARGLLAAVGEVADGVLGPALAVPVEAEPPCVDDGNVNDDDDDHHHHHNAHGDDDGGGGGGGGGDAARVAASTAAAVEALGSLQALYVGVDEALAAVEVAAAGDATDGAVEQPQHCALVERMLSRATPALTRSGAGAAEALRERSVLRLLRQPAADDDGRSREALAVWSSLTTHPVETLVRLFRHAQNHSTALSPAPDPAAAEDLAGHPLPGAEAEARGADALLDAIAEVPVEVEGLVSEKGRRGRRILGFAAANHGRNHVAELLFPKYLRLFRTINACMARTGADAVPFLAAALDAALQLHARCHRLGGAVSEVFMFLTLLAGVNGRPVSPLVVDVDGDLRHVRAAVERLLRLTAFVSPTPSAPPLGDKAAVTSRALLAYLHHLICHGQMNYNLFAVFLPPLRALGVDYSTAGEVGQLGCAVRYPLSAHAAYFAELPCCYFARDPSVASCAAADALAFLTSFVFADNVSIRLFADIVACAARAVQRHLSRDAHAGRAAGPPSVGVAATDSATALFHGVLRLCAMVTHLPAPARRRLQHAISDAIHGNVPLVGHPADQVSATGAPYRLFHPASEARNELARSFFPKALLLRVVAEEQPGAATTAPDQPAAATAGPAPLPADPQWEGFVFAPGAADRGAPQPRYFLQWMWATEYCDVSDHPEACALTQLRLVNRTYLQHLPPKPVSAHRLMLEQYKTSQASVTSASLAALARAVEADVEVLWARVEAVAPKAAPSASASPPPPAGGSGGTPAPKPVVEYRHKRKLGERQPIARLYLDAVGRELTLRATASPVDGAFAGRVLRGFLTSIAGLFEAQLAYDMLKQLVLGVTAKLTYASPLECRSLGVFMQVVLETVLVPYLKGVYLSPLPLQPAAQTTATATSSPSAGGVGNAAAAPGVAPIMLPTGNVALYVHDCDYTLPHLERLAAPLLSNAMSELAGTIGRLLASGTYAGDLNALTLTRSCGAVLRLVKRVSDAVDAAVVQRRTALQGWMAERIKATTGAAAAGAVPDLPAAHPVALLEQLPRNLLEGMTKMVENVTDLFSPLSARSAVASTALPGRKPDVRGAQSVNAVATSGSAWAKAPAVAPSGKPPVTRPPDRHGGDRDTPSGGKYHRPVTSTTTATTTTTTTNSASPGTASGSHRRKRTRSASPMRRREAPSGSGGGAGGHHHDRRGGGGDSSGAPSSRRRRR